MTLFYKSAILKLVLLVLVIGAVLMQVSADIHTANKDAWKNSSNSGLPFMGHYGIRQFPLTEDTSVPAGLKRIGYQTRDVKARVGLFMGAHALEKGTPVSPGLISILQGVESGLRKRPDLEHDYLLVKEAIRCLKSQ